MSKKLQKSSDYSDFFNTLIEVCDRKHLTVTSLIDKFASSKSAMSAWKNGTINTSVIPKLALELGVSIEYLFTGKENSPSLPKDEQELLDYYQRLPERERMKLIGRAAALAEVYEEQIKEPEPIQLIPTYYISNRVSAGFGEYLEDYEQGKTVYVPDTPESRKADFVLTVSGDSMEPKFHDGDNILVRSQPTIEIGQIGIFDVDGDGYIKKLGAEQLISLNSKYPNIPLKDRYARCFGLVLGTTDIVK